MRSYKVRIYKQGIVPKGLDGYLRSSSKFVIPCSIDRSERDPCSLTLHSLDMRAMCVDIET